MDKHYVYKTEGVCASEVSFDIQDGIVKNVQFNGGCRGNSDGVAKLAEGMEAEDVILRCKGVHCKGVNSCPNELAKAVEKCLNEG